ncbi:ABC transporter ATP-binding protein [Vallicoccus soli]|uniref:ABC transporter ATP-binding protein n=1 Tax=Vallicoccus soli TaxID=2339232 RepID=A0A3A3Z0V1_9ACTN|nr:ABC transporter ATP-binding protein [Vallicoccus soli]RJK96036.1 ABC transporter ATP-binding protein [Vallicoccus soli]
MSTAVTALEEMERRAARPGEAYGADAHVVCDGLVRIYRTEGVEVLALQGLDLLVRRGEVVAVVGASGSGKSTLLGILSGLDRPTAGSARVGGQDLGTMTRAQRLRFRRHVVGFVWQQTSRNLLPYLTAAENVAVPLAAAGVRRRARERRVAESLEVLGVGDCRDRRPGELSGGQQQRVAIAVACANRPEVLLADEPTGELDEATSAEVLGALRGVNRELGTTVLVVTHDEAVAGQVERTVAIRDGRTASEVVRRVERRDGQERLVATEYAVLDRAGRLQLPREFTEALGLRERVRLELGPDHIVVRPDERGGDRG